MVICSKVSGAHPVPRAHCSPAAHWLIRAARQRASSARPKELANSRSPRQSTPANYSCLVPSIYIFKTRPVRLAQIQLAEDTRTSPPARAFHESSQLLAPIRKSARRPSERPARDSADRKRQILSSQCATQSAAGACRSRPPRVGSAGEKTRTRGGDSITPRGAARVA